MDKKSLIIVLIAVCFVAGSVYAQGPSFYNMTSKFTGEYTWNLNKISSPDEAVKRVEAAGESAKKLSAEEVKKLKEQLGAFFAWLTAGMQKSESETIAVSEVYMTNMDVGVGFDSEGKAHGEFTSAGEKSVVRMKDGKEYLYYKDDWWDVTPPPVN